jgi:hypothetical protein
MSAKAVLIAYLIVAGIIISLALIATSFTAYLAFTGNNWFTYVVTSGECWQLKDCFAR